MLFLIKPRREIIVFLLSSQLHLLHHLPVVKVDDALGIGGVALRVGHHDDGGALVVQLAEQLHHLAAVLRVEVAGGLVGKDELGTGDDGTGDGDALLLTAGELAGEVLGTVADVHAAHGFLHTLAALGLGKAHVE